MCRKKRNPLQVRVHLQGAVWNEPHNEDTSIISQPAQNCKG